jgi:uncharacterized protein YxeA
MGVYFMKKIIVTVIAVAMVLSNVAFAADKNTNANTGKSYVASSLNRIHLQVNDPDGW